MARFCESSRSFWAYHRLSAESHDLGPMEFFNLVLIGRMRLGSLHALRQEVGLEPGGIRSALKHLVDRPPFTSEPRLTANLREFLCRFNLLSRGDASASARPPRDRSDLWQFFHAEDSGGTSSTSPGSSFGSRANQPQRRWPRTPKARNGVNLSRASTTLRSGERPEPS